MPDRFVVQQFVREFFEALASEARQFFAAPGPIEILEERPERLVLRVGRRQIVVDRASRTIRSGGRLLAPFGAIETIEVERRQHGDDGEIFRVRLRLLRDRFVVIGQSFDDLDVSLVAAKLSTLTDKRVVARR